MDGASQIALGIEELNDPSDAGNRGFWHDNLPAIRFHGVRNGVDIIDGDRTLETENRLRCGVELARLHSAERREELACRVFDLAEIGDRSAAKALKLPVEDGTVKFA